MVTPTIPVSARKCPLCHSENLEYGITMGFRPSVFIPADSTFLTRILDEPYSVSAYVCLDCGALENYLDEESIQDLRKLKAKKSKK